ncbi:hypothetical protein [Rugosimonospora africana]|uniref:hypothetical protein n=1 Tax=Rugosimonospora africana TaxID=556532 RepID=UPI0035712792
MGIDSHTLLQDVSPRPGQFLITLNGQPQCGQVGRRRWHLATVSEARPHQVIAGHAFIQNLRRGYYELAADTPPALRVAAAFNELAQAT